MHVRVPLYCHLVIAFYASHQTEQWSDYYDDGEDETVSSQDAYKYYFPENFEGDFRHVLFKVMNFKLSTDYHLHFIIWLQ